MTELAFTKMHGLGNDFVVIDARAGKPGAGFAIGDAVAPTGIPESAATS